MAKKCMVRRNKKVNKRITLGIAKRKSFRESVNDENLDFAEKMAVLKKWQKKKLFTSRRQERCALTGRAKGVWSKFRMCRHFIRKIGMEDCEIPGLVKSSW